ncbi:unknown protein [Microcystis aeruginosa NIES-843]|uniref:Uncharacterized protein n=1 Tax=Microcystis aeruginosa (strain NIES-843 / IAM M-2473) TaxID=449447 RepID=B0JXP6_MICAN|nr:unknown protein [Microcystis aeruginosa NIES-843]
MRVFFRVICPKMKGSQAGTDSHYIYKYMSSPVFSQEVWSKISSFVSSFPIG